MNGDLNFSISTEELSEKGREIQNQAKIIEDALNDINDARASLNSWVSANKERYDSRIANTLPKMSEMANTVDSYGKAPIAVAARATETENRLAAAIDNSFLG